jgi:hypothetical protein
VDEAQQIADQIRLAIPKLKGGTLRFFGDWFGRPYDNIHTVLDAVAEDNCLILTLDGSETLRLWDPKGYVGDKYAFKILAASRVRWEWYFYGRPRLPENLYYREYVVRASGEIEARTNVDWYLPNLQPTIDSPAIELV